MLITVAQDPQALAVALADRVVLQAQAAAGQSRRFCLALSGGKTPADLYRELARRGSAIPWAALDIYFSDERAVGPDHPDSNFRLAQELWLKQAPAGTRIHRIPGERGAAEAARAYEELLTRTDETAFFDLVFLGLGTDGHIASLFPDSCLNTDKTVVAVPAAGPRTARISLSLRALCSARTRFVVAQGAGKARALKESVAPGAKTPLAQLLACAPVEFWLDGAAAAGLCPFPPAP